MFTLAQTKDERKMRNYAKATSEIVVNGISKFLFFLPALLAEASKINILAKRQQNTISILFFIAFISQILDNLPFEALLLKVHITLSYFGRESCHFECTR